MTKTRAFLYASLALFVALGVCGQQALAGDVGSHGETGIILTDHWTPGPVPEAAAAVLAGPVSFDVPPPSVGPPPSWPCVAPKSPCTGDPAGGLLMGVPLQEAPITGTNNCTMVKCGQILAMFETTTATGAVSATITIKQGTTTIFSGKAKGATAKANQVGLVYLNGAQLATTAVAGAATVTVTTTVGTTKVSGKTTIYLM